MQRRQENDNSASTVYRGPVKIWYGNIAITFRDIVNAEQSINVSESFSNINR